MRCFFVVAFSLAIYIFPQVNVRDRYHQPDKVMDVVGVKPGMVIGEVGAGSGYFTFHLSRRVGDSGKIYANDISTRALAALRRKSEQEGISNIETIVGQVEDPLFPDEILDMVFIVNAFHDLARPVELLDNLVPSLKPGAQVVIIDRDPDKVGGFNRHVLTQAEVLEHIENSAFILDRIETFLPQHNIYIIKCPNSTAVYQERLLEKLWETEKSFKIPESVVIDIERHCFYVSNYDGKNPSHNQGKQSISRVTLDGREVNLDWVSGLNNPTGLAIFRDKLYVVERQNLVEIDLDAAEIIARHPVPQPVFLNDVAVDDSGNFYISDSNKHVIYRFAGVEIEEWIKGGEIKNPNGLHFVGGNLFVGNNGDQCLKAVDCESKKVATIANLGPGIIDGIQSDKKGNLIVSHWEGKIYRISPGGAEEKLLDLSVSKTNTADFAYWEERGLIVIPTFANNRILVYQLKNN